MKKKISRNTVLAKKSVKRTGYVQPRKTLVLRHTIHYTHFHLKTKVEDSIGKHTLIKNTASTDTILAQNSTIACGYSKINKLASISMTMCPIGKNCNFLFFLKVLFILPRHSSQYATARVKLAKHRVEPQDHLTFCLVKRKKVTLYLKVKQLVLD